MTSNLNDIAYFVNEKINIEELNDLNYISTENMLPDKSGITKSSGLPNANYTQCFSEGDILLSNIRPYFKKIWYATFNGGCSNDVLVLRAKSNVCSKFLYYVLSDDKFFEYDTATSKGTKMPRGDKVAIMKYSVPKYDLTTQEKIARVLSSLDDKIELNNKINQNLEQQAQAIYNQLILTQKLKEKTLSEIIEITDGTHDSPKVKEEGYYLITSKHLSKYGVNKDNANYISEEDFNKINERSKVDKYDILMSMIGTVGLVSLIIEDDIDFAVKNVGIFKTSLQKDYIYFIFSYLLSSSTQNYVKSHLAGTTQKYISLGELRNLKIKIPNEKILASFNNLVHPIYQKIIYNTNEIKILTQLRDTLLPKLMSGEIDVDKVEA